MTSSCRRVCNRLSDTFVCDAGDGGGSSSSLGELWLSANACLPQPFTADLQSTCASFNSMVASAQ